MSTSAQPDKSAKKGAKARKRAKARKSLPPDQLEGTEETSGLWVAGSFSVEEADRLAATFRPSWEGVVPLEDEEADEGQWGLPPAASPSPASEPPAPRSEPPPAVAARPRRATPAVSRAQSVPPPPPLQSRAPLIVGALIIGAIIIGLGFYLRGSGAVPATARVTADPPSPSVVEPPAPDPRPEPVAAPEPEPAAAVAVAEPEPEPVAAVAEPEPEPEPVAVAPAPEPEPVAVAPAPEPEPEPATVRVRIRTLPADATLMMDGTRIANPYDATLNQAPGTHRISASADGYEDATATVSFERNVSEVIRLSRERSAAPTPPVVAARPPRPTRERPTTTRPARPTPMTSMGAGFVTDNPY